MGTAPFEPADRTVRTNERGGPNAGRPTGHRFGGHTRSRAPDKFDGRRRLAEFRGVGTASDGCYTPTGGGRGHPLGRVRSRSPTVPSRALQTVSFELPAGEILGLLGPNGAGKSTMMKSILGLVRPETGRIPLFGRPSDSDPTETKRHIGYVPENPALYEFLTGAEYLDFVADMYGLTGRREPRGSNSSSPASSSPATNTRSSAATLSGCGRRSP